MASGSGDMARKGMEMIRNATKSGMSAISKTLSKARLKDNSHEAKVLAELRETGLTPRELVFQALRKAYHLYMAGYMHELAVAGMDAGKRLTQADTSSVPLDVVLVFGHSLCEESQKYGKLRRVVCDKSKVSGPHLDRSSLVHDIYYALIVVTQAHGTEWNVLEQIFKESSARVIASAIQPPSDVKEVRLRAATALFIFGEEIRSIAMVRKEQERIPT